MAGKTDMERVALFKEMSYHTIGDPYKSNANGAFNQAAYKGKQMLPGGSKEKSAKVDGYFQEFSRILEGEAYTDAIKLRRQHRIRELKKNVGKNWTPSSPSKLSSGQGNVFGTFSGPVPHFSALSKGKHEYKVPGKNVQTNPPKKGTGYGYLGVTLGKYPDYKADAYEKGKEIMRKENENHKASTQGRGAFHLNMHSVDYFDMNPYKGGSPLTRPVSKSDKNLIIFRPSNPGKKEGGGKLGTFDPFPTYSSELYKRKTATRPVHVVNNTGKTYVPNSGLKTAPNVSIVNKSVVQRMNSTNYKTTVPAFLS